MNHFEPEWPLMRLSADKDARPEFHLVGAFAYVSDKFGRIEVPDDAWTDGASVPQLGMAFVGYPGMRAAIVHDYLCKHPEYVPIPPDLKDKEPREVGDLIFQEALAVCGVGPVTIFEMYSAVAGYTESLKPKDNTYIG